MAWDRRCCGNRGAHGAAMERSPDARSLGVQKLTSRAHHHGTSCELHEVDELLRLERNLQLSTRFNK
eukprot:4790822-Amphidinium_carterae.2